MFLILPKVHKEDMSCPMLAGIDMAAPWKCAAHAIDRLSFKRWHLYDWFASKKMKEILIHDSQPTRVIGWNIVWGEHCHSHSKVRCFSRIRDPMTPGSWLPTRRWEQIYTTGLWQATPHLPTFELHHQPPCRHHPVEHDLVGLSVAQ